MKSTALTRQHGVTEKQVLMIAAGAGIISALLPSVPTVIRYWNDQTKVTVFGREISYHAFLKGWLIASALGLGLLFYKYKTNNNKKARRR
jgi:hypothetical protein